MAQTKIKVIKVDNDAALFEERVNDFTANAALWNKATQTHIFKFGESLIYVAVCYYEERP
jgi:hypothetical protein